MTQRLALIYTFLLTFFEEVSRTQMSLHDNGFIESTNDVRYFMDDISNMHKEFSVPRTKVVEEFVDATNRKSKILLKFDPDILDFKERVLGVPHHEKVTVINMHSNKTVVMTSISGNTVHFHSSFFEDKVIPPLGNTSFNVVFLGRQEGPVDSTLLIHTSEGSVKYKVKGDSAASPYRLRPLVDIRLPVNASFSPLIYMHNPHQTAIQVIEVYSSGGEFHLELPTGELEGPKHMWEIPPHQTRAVIRVRFNARTESNHTAYVRIKLNKSEEVLVVPLEVEVGVFPGLHSPQGGVDFGLGGSLDAPKRVKLLLHNTWKKPIRIQSITPATDADVISVDFQPVKVPAVTSIPTAVAVLTINWKAAYERKHFCGHLVIRSKQVPHDMLIPYWATVLPGGLVFNASTAQYLSNKGPLDVSDRKFVVTNLFQVPLVVLNVTLPQEAQSHFMVHHFSRVLIHPNKSTSIFNLKFKRNSILNDFNFESNILIYSNISTVKVPLLSYDGKLKKIIPFADTGETVLDLGLIGVDSTKESYLIFSNSNPTDVQLLKWGTDLKSATVKLVGCSSGNVTEASLQHTFANLSECSVLRPGEFALFLVRVSAPSLEGQLWGEMVVETQFEAIATPVTVRIAHGNFEVDPDKMVFDECFPNKICTHPVRVHSTFMRGMDLLGITSVPPDPRLSYHLAEHSAEGGVMQIAPRTLRVVAFLRLDPSLTCAPHCYTGFILNSTVGSQWLNTFSLSRSTYEFDLNMLNIKYGRYMNITANGKLRWQNLTLRLDTTEVKGHMCNTRVKLSWPRLVSGSAITNRSLFTFPITQIGNTSYHTISLRNPSSYVLVLHLVMDWMYPESRNLYEQLPNAFKPGCSNCPQATAPTFFFVKDHWTNSDNFLSAHNISTHRETAVLLVPPTGTVTLTVGFNAASTSMKSALIYIRNNLTVMEVVRVVGQGAYPALKFGNRKPGSTTPLLFELADKHLRDCEKEKFRKNPSPNLTVKRSFTARNIGDIPIYFKGFYINGFPCEGFGFKVLNCEPFKLLSNGTRKVDIAFTPDFTLAKIQRTLVIDTSLSIEVNYTLVTTVPPYYLAPCSNVLTRPPWEPLLYYSAVSFMSFLLFCILAAAFLESDRIIQYALAVLARDSFTLQQPLDLRLIGAQTRTEIKLNKTEVETSGVQTPTAPSTAPSPKPTCNGTVHEAVTKRSQKEALSSAVGSINGVKNVTSWPVTPEPVVVTKTPKSSPTPGKYETQPLGPTTKPAAPVIKSKKKLSKKNSNGSESIGTDNAETAKKQVSNGLVNKVVAPMNGIRGKTPPAFNTVNNRKSRRDEEVPKKKPVESESVKKHTLNHKKVKTNDVVCSEEETSSTTTESSNNEDGDKENVSNAFKNDKNRKLVPKKPKSTINTNDYRDSYEGDDEDYERVNKQSTNSGPWKLRTENKIAVVVKFPATEPVTVTAETKAEKEPAAHKARGNRNTNRERKEKTVQKKRSATEKSVPVKLNAVVVSHETSTCKLVTRVSPTIPPPNCWGEHRARFSDVVARDSTTFFKEAKRPSESPGSSSGSQLLQPAPSPSILDNHRVSGSAGGGGSSSSVVGGGCSGAAGTLVDVETPNAHLGPIGSKKTQAQSNIWESVTPDSQLLGMHTSVSGASGSAGGPVAASSSNTVASSSSGNSPAADPFFNFADQAPMQTLDSACLAAARMNAALVCGGTDMWDQQQPTPAMSMMHLLHNSARMLGDYSHLNYYQNSWNASNNSSLWDPVYLPPAAVGDERQQQQQQQQQQAVGLGLGVGVSSVWDSSPWTPPVAAPGTPTRTPPGFPARPQDENERTLGFDPFRSLSNIWSPPRAPPS